MLMLPDAVDATPDADGALLRYTDMMAIFCLVFFAMPTAARYAAMRRYADMR